jgi:hypothetical protein
MSARYLLVPLVCVVALVSATCSDDSSSPTAPSPTTSTPPPAPTPTPPPAPSRGSIEVSIVPSPVPFSGQPISNVSSCANSKNTWFYDQVIRETGGSTVTFTQRVDRFDGQTVNNLSGLSLVVPANGSITINSRWCSTTAAEHTAESSFSGTDASGNAITAGGGIVRLMRP